MILAIDPGTTKSGYIKFGGRGPYECGELDNQQMLVEVERWSGDLAIEMVASYGMAVGKEVFETVRWIGRFQQAYRNPDKVKLIYRQDVKLGLCHSMKAKDANIRQAIIDLFPPSGKGSCPQVGTKLWPGPLFGVASHVWPALGVALIATKGSAINPFMV